jgi:hypothetical protein
VTPSSISGVSAVSVFSGLVTQALNRRLGANGSMPAEVSFGAQRESAAPLLPLAILQVPVRF